jgi:hypothetical protein
MRIWETKEFKTKTSLGFIEFQLQNQGEEVEFQLEERLGTVDNLVWINLDETQVDELIAWLQEWKNASK